MSSILFTFIKELFNTAKYIKFNTLPQKISSLIYDPRFNISEINDIEDIEDEPGLCYKIIFQEIESMIKGKKLIYIADSSDFNDGPEVGDYNFYAGWIHNEIPLIYSQASHPHSTPHRLIIMDEIFSYEIWSCKKEIEIYPTPDEIRKNIMNANVDNPSYGLKCYNRIKSLLRSQDRPELDKL